MATMLPTSSSPIKDHELGISVSRSGSGVTAADKTYYWHYNATRVHVKTLPADFGTISEAVGSSSRPEKEDGDPFGSPSSFLGADRLVGARAPAPAPARQRFTAVLVDLGLTLRRGHDLTDVSGGLIAPGTST